MSTKINSRILLKTDLTENWNKADNFSPKKGEICVYSDAEAIYNEDGETISGYLPRIKIGDGETNIKDLPFVGDELITEEEIRDLFNAE